MTIICTLRDETEGRFLLGCNSRSSVGDTVMPADVTKWQRFGEWALAMSGNGIPFELLERRRAKFPAETENPYEVSAFIRKTFDKEDYGKGRGEGRDYGASGILVRRSGQAYDIDSHMTLERVEPSTLWARGSGMDYGLGAAFAMRGQGGGARAVMTAALEAAIALDTSCPGTPMIEVF